MKKPKQTPESILEKSIEAKFPFSLVLFGLEIHVL